MLKRFFLIALSTFGITFGTLVPQPIIEDVQRVTQQMSIDSFDLGMYGELTGGITCSYSNN